MSYPQTTSPLVNDKWQANPQPRPLMSEEQFAALKRWIELADDSPRKMVDAERACRKAFGLPEVGP